MTVRHGFGWALVGAVLWGLAAAIGMMGGTGLAVEALVLVGVLLLISGLVVAAVSLIRSR